MLITAAADKLRRAAGRARARGQPRAAASRLARGDAYDVNDPRLVTIVNDGALEAAAEAFVRLLATTSLLTRRPPPSLKRASTVKGRSGAG